jgi:hypothetical protein
MIISNTRITAKNVCDKQHDYMYNQNLEPRKYSIPIQRGIAGHKVLETYYLARYAGESHDVAVNEAMNRLYFIVAESDPDDIEHTQMLAHLSWLLTKYFECYKDDKFKVISVEGVYSAPLINDIYFGMILDVVIELTTGPFCGQYEIWDHKFVHNFMSVDDLRLNGQQPKYIKVARLNNLPIRQAIFNQIRYRKMKNPVPADLFRRSPLMSSDTAIEQVWRDTQTVGQIIMHDNSEPVRALNYSACKFCFFKDLCMTELAGEPTEIMRKVQYQKRISPMKDWMLSNA